jgi:hypothetical protein
MGGPRQYRQVKSHPAKDRFPAGCPTDSPRSDVRGYAGLHLRVWVNQRSGLETALYRATAVQKSEYGILLRLMLDHLLRYRGQPERVNLDGQPLNADRFRLLDIGVDKNGTWGPGLAFPPGPTATLEELTEAAVYDLRDRMPVD